MYFEGTFTALVRGGVIAYDSRKMVVTRGVHRKLAAIVSRIRFQIKNGQSIKIAFEQYCVLVSHFMADYGLDLAGRFGITDEEYVAWCIYLGDEEEALANQPTSF
jgi:hypothetical protein